MIAQFMMACRKCKRSIPVGTEYITQKGEGGKFHPKCAVLVASIPQSNLSQNVKRPVYQRKPLITPPPALLIPNGLEYLPYQVDGIHKIIARIRQSKNTLLADEMGLGKTIQAIGAMNQFPELRKVAIVTPTSLRYNWLSELKTWLKVDNRIIGFFPEVDNIESLDFAIIPYSMLEALPSSYIPEWLILDEAHYVKNPDAIRTKWLVRLAKRIPTKLFLSGSPIENRVKELFTLLQMLDPETWDPAGYMRGMAVGVGEGAGWIRFAKLYCGAHIRTVYRKGKNGKPVQKKFFDFEGSTCLPELNERLYADGLVVRRLKKDVLKDLPEKRRKLVVLPQLDETLIQREHQAFAATGLDYGEDISVLHKASIEFEELSKARKEVGLSKVRSIVEYIEDCFENSPLSPLVVFCHHKEVAHKLADEFIQKQPAVITGDTPEALRHTAVQRFQLGDTLLFIGTSGAAGVGITLTASSHMIIAEPEWKDMSQVEDRIHRIGQKNSALIEVLVYDWSVDANMVKVIWRKMGIVEKAVNPQSNLGQNEKTTAD